MSSIVEQLDEIKEYSGIPRLKDCLEKRLFKSTRRILYARMSESFQDFLKQIHDIVEDRTEVYNERLKLLATKESELNERRQALADVEELTMKIQEYMDKVRGEVGGVK